jgi:prepilin peptidase CpaA
VIAQQGWVGGVLLLALLACASANDLRRHRIPNALVLIGIALGITGQVASDGWFGLGNGLLGALIGFAIFIPLYALGGMAAGDVKLMAMVGTFMAPQQALLASLLALMAGGVGGLLLIAVHGQLRQTLIRYTVMLGTHRYLVPAKDEVAGKRFPYAIAILLGTLGSMLWFEFAR